MAQLIAPSDAGLNKKIMRYSGHGPVPHKLLLRGQHKAGPFSVLTPSLRCSEGAFVATSLDGRALAALFWWRKVSVMGFGNLHPHLWPLYLSFS